MKTRLWANLFVILGAFVAVGVDGCQRPAPAAPVASSRNHQAAIRLTVESNVEVTVLLDGRALDLGKAHLVAAGDVTLTLRYHDGNEWCEDTLTVRAEAGYCCAYVLTLRVPMRSWLI